MTPTNASLVSSIGELVEVDGEAAGLRQQLILATFLASSSCTRNSRRRAWCVVHSDHSVADQPVQRRSLRDALPLTAYFCGPGRAGPACAAVFPPQRQSIAKAVGPWPANAELPCCSPCAVPVMSRHIIKNAQYATQLGFGQLLFLVLRRPSDPAIDAGRGGASLRARYDHLTAAFPARPSRPCC